MTDSPFGLGALERPEDRRDYKIGLSQSPVVRPDKYIPDHSNIPVKMQGKFGTCGAHAGAMMESMFENIDFSPKYLWKQIKSFDGYGLDQGTDMRSIFKALNSTGDCRELLCPDVLDPTIEQYSDIKTLTDDMLNDAYPHGVDHYAFTDHPSMGQIKQAIFTNGCVIARVDCGDGWWVNGWQESVTCPLKLGNYASGHFIVLWGYDQNYIYFRNSWSNAWGRNGDGYFDYTYISHVKEIGVGIDSPSVKQQIIFKYQQLIVLLQKMLGMFHK